MQPDTGIVKLIVTGRWPHVARQIKSELRKAIPGAHIRSAGFRSVFILEAAGDVLELAQRINRDCAEDIGHVTPALAEVESKPGAIRSRKSWVSAGRCRSDFSAGTLSGGR